MSKEQPNCICGCPAAQHKRFGCTDCTCLSYQATGATNEAWVLCGYELWHGEVIGRDRQLQMVNFEPDGGEPLFVPFGAVAYTPEQVRTLLAKAVAQLGQTAQQFDRQFAPQTDGVNQGSVAIVAGFLRRECSAAEIEQAHRNEDYAALRERVAGHFGEFAGIGLAVRDACQQIVGQTVSVGGTN